MRFRIRGVAWSLSGRSSSVAWYAPRVEYGIYGDPVYSVVCLVCKLAMVQTLTGGELGIMLGGSAIHLSCSAKDWFMGICGPGI